MPSPSNSGRDQIISAPSPVNSFHPANNNQRPSTGTADRAVDSKPDIAKPAQQAPPRPPLRSNFELEPNPFEQSFSASSSSLSSLRQSINHNQKNVPSPPSSTSGNKSPSSTRSSPSRKQSLSNGVAHPNGDTPKPILPPLASITSPSDPSYAWAFSSAGLTNSLRAGPLSPAMLAGPQTQQPTTTAQSASSIAALAASAGSVHPPLFPFDPSGSFRTGLTPSTGLTPLVGGPVAFPPPSPNTAAFLAMVNSGAAGSAAAATITPNTLNALAGVLGTSTSTASQIVTGQQANGVSSNNNGSSNTHTNGNANSSSSPTQSEDVVPTSVAPSQVAAPPSSTYQNGSLNSQSRGSNSYSDATGAANHAANGLFLLSQAHQELTKREEAQKQSMAHANGVTKGPAAQSQAGQSMTNGAGSAKRGSKRKVETTSVTSNTSNKGGASKKSKSSSVSTRGSTARRASTVSNQEGEEGEGEDEESAEEEQQQQSSQALHPTSNKQKKFETEEEKRRNFLERNRQAALKCRQRKKQWLAQLQAKNEYLQNENERLTAALVASREEISRLSQLVGGAGVGLPSGVVPMVGVAGMGVQHQQVHHAPYLAHQQQHHPIAVPVSLSQGSASVTATATSPPMATKASPHLQHHHSQQQVHHSPNPHSPTSDGRSSRSSFRDVRDYANGVAATTAGRENGSREYTRDMREREMGHVHGHTPQAVVVNGRGYGY